MNTRHLIQKSIKKNINICVLDAKRFSIFRTPFIHFIKYYYYDLNRKKLWKQ